MKNEPSASKRVLVIAALSVLAYAGARRLAQVSSAWRAAEDLRDALSDNGASDVAQRHSRLVADPKAACALCHLPHRVQDRRPAWAGLEAGPSEAAGSLPDTAVCLSCHSSPATGSLGSVPGLRGNHPVGMDYRVAWMGHPDQYRSPDGNPDIRLEDGKVGCLSCHRLHAGGSAQARAGVVENACEACHNR